ncbi:uncharacterized protein I303_107451 [Kwoniella dejecticola CBS 10117]|uniref:G-patch domain-containing protein n=1 Tax=Kwoniella dejecticola CBS 10117 TaxID=1296121 RepID=A0A1A5ZZR1_9TREE|nr:uncharacterized protein I303_06855 [Kwoniella dejecticola CBS 10117]OBR83292.1 hypothetical protein I303_06855 [Kwoniella dejecticola CBS 10117]
MSDSEDDFMSDKFLVDPSASTSTSSSSSKSKLKGKTYSEQRNIDQLKSLRRGQAKNQIPLKQLEEQRRKEGLSRSLFDQTSSGFTSTGGGAGGGGGAALGMMQKMGWNIGESLGKRRSPPSSAIPQSSGVGGGIGSSSMTSKRPKFLPGDENEEGIPKPDSRVGVGVGRTEPIRISMWNGRRGIGQARSASPPPLPANLSGRDPDALDSKKLARLTRETDDFRTRQRKEYGEKEKERKGRAAREKLRSFDQEKGVKFHPLHIIPWLPLETIPRPLLKLVYPSQAFSPSPPSSPRAQAAPVEGYEKESNLSAAERLRRQMRDDMLSESRGEGDGDSDDEEGLMRFGVIKEDDGDLQEGKKLPSTAEIEDEYAGVHWEDHVDGVKRVLSMDPETYLQFVIDQLRTEHLFCFWCSYKYASFDEMDGVGGCPGVEEDDH